MSDSGGSKKCPDCGQLKPVSQFGRNKRMADGLARYCKECFGLRSKASYRKRMAERGKEVRERPAVPDGFRYCPQCGEVKSASEFGRNGAKKDGLASYCRPCHNTVMAANKTKNHGSTRSYHLKRRYGMTEEEVEELSESMDASASSVCTAAHCTLITITPPERSGECCASVATARSASSKMTSP